LGNIFGHHFRVTTFGESHGPAVGAIVDGLPARLTINLADIQKDLDRRRPGQSLYASARQESDTVEILSGLTNQNMTNGSSLTMVIKNQGARSSDYVSLVDKFRPGHADYTYYKKYCLAPQPGGGRASGRETVGRVAAGAVARILLNYVTNGLLKVRAGALAIGPVMAYKTDFEFAETDPLRFLDPDGAQEAQGYVKKYMNWGDSVGATILVRAEGVPAGWGSPVFDKLEALLGGAYFSIGAVRAVEFGEGITLAKGLGSQANDPIGPKGPLEDRHGGVLGGISTGRPILARLFVRPTPSIKIPQKTVSLNGQEVEITIGGRHDPCLAPRLAPVAEAMTLLVLADCFLAPNSRVSQAVYP
jgi:chorismate synthase